MIPFDTLGQYYEKVAPSLANELPNITNDDIPNTSKYTRKVPKIEQSFEFKTIFEREVYELILNLDTKNTQITTVVASVRHYHMHELTS